VVTGFEDEFRVRALGLAGEGDCGDWVAGPLPAASGELADAPVCHLNPWDNLSRWLSLAAGQGTSAWAVG
jgi:hypothetical protein